MAARSYRRGVAPIRLTDTKVHWRDPADWALFLIAVIPLFPEYISFVLVIAATICGIWARRQPSGSKKPGLISQLLTLYVVYMGISLAFAVNKNDSLATFAMWGFFLGMFTLLRSLLTSRERFETMACFVTLTAAIVGLIACCQFYIGDLTGTNPIRFWDFLDKIVYRWLPIEISQLPYALRSCSTFNNPNVLSEYLTMTIPFGVFYATGQSKSAQKHIAHLCLIFMVAGVVFSFSRGGYIALAVLLAALAFFNLRDHFSSIVIYAFSGLLLIPGRAVERILSILPGIATGSDILESFTAPGEQITSAAQEIIQNSGADMAINIRWQIWLESLRLFVQRPLFGYGAGTHTTWELLKQQNLPVVHTHNLVLQLLVEGGLIALAIMLCLGLKTVKSGLVLMRKNRKPRSFWLGYALIGFSVAFCVQGMFDFPLMTPKLVCHFVMILALAERATVLFDIRPFSVRTQLKKRWDTGRRKRNTSEKQKSGG